MHADEPSPTRKSQEDDETERHSPRSLSANAPVDLTGHILSGKYRVLRKLGSGGFGAVYEARDEMLGASVAVKVLTPAAAQQKDALQQFLGEARLLTSLNDPNIVRWITFDRTPTGLHYFVMEILKGSELTKVLDDVDRLPPERAMAILLQVLSALRAAHSLPDGRCLLHLDLKPQNVFVLVGEPEQIKVIDFGISQHVGAAARHAAGIGTGPTTESEEEDLGKTLATVPSRADQSWFAKENGVQRARGGTPLYASPEQCKHLRGDPDIVDLDARSDLYSLGVMAFQMLTGRLPWLCHTREQAYRAHIETPAPPMSRFGVKLPRGLEQFVARCLAKDRDDRFANVQEAFDALERVANPPSKWPQFVGAGALAAGLLIWQLWPSPPPSDVEVARSEIYFGPARTSAKLRLTDLDRDRFTQPVAWVTSRTEDRTDLRGWSAKVDMEDGTPIAALAPPADLAGLDRVIDTRQYLRFGEDGTYQHSQPIRVVWLPKDACAIESVAILGDGDRQATSEQVVVDPKQARLSIDLRGERGLVERVVVSAAGKSLAAQPSSRGAKLFELELREFGFAANGREPTEFQVLVVDKAGNEHTWSRSWQVDGRRMAFDWSLDARSSEGQFMVYPNSRPTLTLSPVRPAGWSVVATDESGKIVDLSLENVEGGMRLGFPDKLPRHVGSITVRATDLPTVFHSDASQGTEERTIPYRYETQEVQVDVVARHLQGRGELVRSSDPTRAAWLTNENGCKLELVRKEVLVSVQMECRNTRNTKGAVSTASVDLGRDRGKTIDLALPEDGEFVVTLRGFRQLGTGEHAAEPEWQQTLIIVRDSSPPLLRLAESLPKLQGEVDPASQALAVEVGDDSAEPVALDVRLTGPTRFARTVSIEPGRPDRELLSWSSLGIDPATLTDGRYQWELEARDAATNRSAMATGELVIARKGPDLRLDSPRGPVWTRTTGNLFQVKITGIDPNGVKAVECEVSLADTSEKVSVALVLTVGFEPANGEWTGQASMPWKWSQREVQVACSGIDEFGNRHRTEPVTTRLQAFQPQREPIVRTEVAAAKVATQSMRFVLGDANYDFGGRPDDAGSFEELGLRFRPHNAAGRVSVGDFYLDECEVTVHDFAQFLEHGYANPAHWADVDRTGTKGAPSDERRTALRTRIEQAASPQLPMTDVTWHEAAAYAHWAGKRLPTMQEWEYVVRGGNAYRLLSVEDQSRNSLRLSVHPDRAAPITAGRDLTPKGRGEGIRNLGSNVSEWTSSPFERDQTSVYVVGASFRDPAGHFQKMTPRQPGDRTDTIGFRCAADATAVDAMLENLGRVRATTVEPTSPPKAR